MPLSTLIRAIPRAFTAFERIFEHLLIYRNRRANELGKRPLGMELLEDRLVPTGTPVVTIPVETSSITEGQFGGIWVQR